MPARYSARTVAYAALGVVFVVCVALVAVNAARTSEPGAHVLRAWISTPAPAPPGGTGRIDYVATNTGPDTAQGVLLNASLPPYVTIELGPRCQRTGTNDSGGMLISCNFSAPEGVLASGQSRRGQVEFRVDPAAPRGSELGSLGALIIPLRDGRELEDFTDLSGPNRVRATISTP